MRVGNKRSQRAKPGAKRWGPKGRVMSKASVHALNRSIERRERAEGKRAAREGASEAL